MPVEDAPWTQGRGTTRPVKALERARAKDLVLLEDGGRLVRHGDVESRFRTQFHLNASTSLAVATHITRALR